MEKNILYHGRREDLEERIKLYAGQLELIYEKGFIRYIKIGKHEVLRMINHLVRDHNWTTIPLEITDEKINVSDRSFTIEYKARARLNDIDFFWDCRIEGYTNNSLRFKIQGQAMSDFKRNRIGFTVLHPIKECAGQPVKIIHADGKPEMYVFPELISPDQPFIDIKSMEWSLNSSKVILEFRGDIFETEDQRNWIDESYKTYCTPLALPYPVEVKKGDKVNQEISLRVEGIFKSTKLEDQPQTATIDTNQYSLPKIGICQSTEVINLPDDQIDHLRKIPFDHYQVDLKLYKEGWQEDWDRIKKESGTLNLPLELNLFFDDIKNEMVSFISILEAGLPIISRVNLFNKSTLVTQYELLDKFLPVLKDVFPKAEFGAGTNAFFTQLNRNRLPSKDLDYLVYSINPQVHSFDNDSLVETTFSVPYTIKTVREFSENKPVNISPVTFKMRWNPDATGEILPDYNQFPDNVDPRQMSLFGANWVVGFLNYILPEEPKTISFFETVGMKGIIQSMSPLFPDQFLAPPGMIYPIYFIFKTILENKTAQFFKVESSHPGHFSGLAWGNNHPSTLMLVNYQPNPTKILLPDPFHNGTVSTINESNFGVFMYDPDLFDSEDPKRIEADIELLPFGIAIVKNDSNQIS